MLATAGDMRNPQHCGSLIVDTVYNWQLVLTIDSDVPD